MPHVPNVIRVLSMCTTDSTIDRSGWEQLMCVLVNTSASPSAHNAVLIIQCSVQQQCLADASHQPSTGSPSTQHAAHKEIESTSINCETS